MPPQPAAGTSLADAIPVVVAKLLVVPTPLAVATPNVVVRSLIAAAPLAFVPPHPVATPTAASMPRAVQPAAGGRTSSRRLKMLGLLAALVIGARLPAHDIYTSWTDASVREVGLELTLTLARGSAIRLVPNSDTLAPITPENFAQYLPRLEAVAGGLFEITAAGKPLALGSAAIRISGDADITFHLVYPKINGGPLRFVALYLFRLVDQHVGTLALSDAAGGDLGWSPVSVDQPVFEVRIPAGPARKR